MEFKINIADPKSGKTHKKVLKDDECKQLIGKKIGDTIKGEIFGFAGYELKINGGSDYCGFPMRQDVSGTMRKRILIAGGVGIRSKRKGMRKRKAVAGNQIYNNTAQINLLVTKYGKQPIDKPAESSADKPAGDAAEKKDDKPVDKKDVASDGKKDDKPAGDEAEKQDDKSVEQKDNSADKPKPAPKTEDNKKE